MCRGGGKGCQFDVPDAELIDFDCMTWCRFHLPMATADGTTASGKGEWEPGVIGEFNKDILDLCRGVKETRAGPNFTGVVFPGDIDFSEMEFEGPTSFSGTEFNGAARFNDAQFREVSFRSAQFWGKALFYRVQFDRPGSSSRWCRCGSCRCLDPPGRACRNRDGPSSPPPACAPTWSSWTAGVILVDFMTGFSFQSADVGTRL